MAAFVSSGWSLGGCVVDERGRRQVRGAMSGRRTSDSRVTGVVRMGLPLDLLTSDDMSGQKWLQVAPVVAKREYTCTIPRGGRKQKKAEKIRREADRFGKYMTLRRQLTPWSEYFREEYGRVPSLRDVQESGVPGLLEKFQEYVEIRNHFWSME